MFPAGSLVPNLTLCRKFDVGAAITTGMGSLMKRPTSSWAGQVISATATSYPGAVGVVMDQTPPTYSTVQGTGSSSALKRVRLECNPFTILRAKMSGSATDDAALSAANHQLLTNTSASSGGTVITDAVNIDTVDFAGGILYGLSGQNKGQARTIVSNAASTSVTVTVPFDYAIAVGDTMLRINQNVGQQGIQLTTGVKQVDGSVASFGNPTTSIGACYDVIVDITDQGSATAPLVFVDFVMIDHVWNSID